MTRGHNQQRVIAQEDQAKHLQDAQNLMLFNQKLSAADREAKEKILKDTLKYQHEATMKGIEAIDKQSQVAALGRSRDLTAIKDEDAQNHRRRLNDAAARSAEAQ